MPVCGIEILDGRQHQACIFDVLAKFFQFINSPELLRIAGHSPGLILGAGRLIVARIRGAFVEIIHQVDDHMSAACLPRKVVVFACQHVPV